MTSRRGRRPERAETWSEEAEIVEDLQAALAASEAIQAELGATD